MKIRTFSRRKHLAGEKFVKFRTEFNNVNLNCKEFCRNLLVTHDVFEAISTIIFHPKDKKFLAYARKDTLNVNLYLSLSVKYETLKSSFVTKRI